jgi:hypothetical protein
VTPEEIAQARKLSETPITAENVDQPIEAVFPEPQKPKWPEDYELNPDGVCVVKAGVRERLGLKAAADSIEDARLAETLKPPSSGQETAEQPLKCQDCEWHSCAGKGSCRCKCHEITPIQPPRSVECEHGIDATYLCVECDATPSTVPPTTDTKWTGPEPMSEARRRAAIRIEEAVKCTDPQCLGECGLREIEHTSRPMTKDVQTQSSRESDIEKWCRELCAAGWKQHEHRGRKSFYRWVAPNGALYRGPYEAWRVMKSLEQRRGQL